MDINDEIDMQDLKYKVKELQEKNEELQVELDITKEQLTLTDVVVPKGKFCKWEDHNKGVKNYGECLVCYGRKEQ